MDIQLPQNSRNPSTVVQSTVGPNPAPGDSGMMLREGEGTPAGVSYPTYLREVPNKSPSALQNAGPSAPSANPTMLPAFGKGVRKTGRI